MHVLPLILLLACSSAFKDDAGDDADADRDGTPNSDDCAPQDDSVHPGADEVCDGVDQDCDGLVDDGVTEPGFLDDDGDGYGLQPMDVCAGSSGVSVTGGDCDDADPTRHPGVPDGCNGVDDDCDETVDEDGADAIFRDFDGDGYGDAAQPDVGCAGSAWSLVSGDCDDYEATVSPGAPELCNTLDDDCDGVADSGGVCPCEVQWWPDSEHAYMFCTTPLDWQQSDDACAAYGYRLVTFDSAEEGEWVEATVLTYPSGPSWWIGFSDAAVEASWAWADGSPVAYTNWTPGEPNNSHGGECVAATEEDCAMIRWNGTSWNDYPCACATEYSVCEARSQARPD